MAAGGDFFILLDREENRGTEHASPRPCTIPGPAPPPDIMLLLSL